MKRCDEGMAQSHPMLDRHRGRPTNQLGQSDLAEVVELDLLDDVSDFFELELLESELELLFEPLSDDVDELDELSDELDESELDAPDSDDPLDDLEPGRLSVL